MKLHSESRRLFHSRLQPANSLIIGLLTLFMLCACHSRADFSYSHGAEGYYSDFSGKWLVINYWAEWCKPCIKEIPELNAFAASNKDVNLVGVNFDILPLEKEQVIIKQLDIRFPVARAFLHEHYGYAMPVSLPVTVIISPEGKVHKVLSGPQTAATLTQAVSQ